MFKIVYLLLFLVIGCATPKRVYKVDPILQPYVESIMFHELGHCILYRDHSDSRQSIMYYTLMPTYDYIQNYKSYISELFHINYTKEFDPNVYYNN